MSLPADHQQNRPAPKPARELYRQLRTQTCAQLWDVEVPRFDQAGAQERIERVGVIRAVSVVFAESGTAPQQAAARAWLRSLLKDPAEKVRRYAMNALPKLGAGSADESELLSLLRTTSSEREQRFLGQALGKIGGTATLDTLPAGAAGSLRHAEQKIKARLARDGQASTVNFSAQLPQFAGVAVHLRGRRGLEEIVAAELQDSPPVRAQFRLVEVHPGLVVLAPLAPFSLADVYRLRCFETVGLALGSVNGTHEAELIERLAGLITSARSRTLLQALTQGAIRYRLEFVGRGHLRAAVRQLAERAYELCPELLNDPNEAPWTIEIHATDRGARAELVPKLKPDPRLFYRQGDVPAASHPPLAACLAWLAGPGENEVIWDPFCGSGQELIERALLGGVRRVLGTDLSPEALAVSQRNFAAANLSTVRTQFTEADFRDFAQIPGLGPNTATLMITNPPMGMRVRISDLRGLLADLLTVAGTVLQPGGRLVFPNPIRQIAIPPTLELEYSRTVDMGGFDCRLEVYRKPAKRALVR
jgi:23S rRNA G2445 N2-methylase RlmL